ncbi:MAG: hypothetical protein AAF721_26355 [Myxococcota bacterium]
MLGLTDDARAMALAAGLCLALGCNGDDEEPAGNGTGSDSGTAANPDDGDTPVASTQPDPDDDGGTTNDTTNDTTGDDTGVGPGDDPDSTGDPLPADCDFMEAFDGVADGEDWPSPWVVTGGTEIADVQGGRGRLRPFTSGYSLSRIVAPMNCTNFEATFTFEFTDGNTQGAGFYVRQNGGHLADSNPAGQGYSAFAEAFRDPIGLGVWREVNGAEENLAPVVPMTIEANVVYSVRLRVAQVDASTTSLQARMWPAGGEEPGEWQVERTDGTPSLQGVQGGLAIDAWSVLQEGTASDMFFDDIVVTEAI